MNSEVFDIPEIDNLFGPYVKSGYPCRQDFGDRFVNGAKHWWFSPQDIHDSFEGDRLLVADVEFGTACALRCAYCFRTDDERDGTQEPALDLAEWKSMVDQARDLGVRAVKLIGAGEFFEDRRFMDAFRYLTDSGIKAVLFTSAHCLADEERVRRLHGMSSDEIIDYLYANDHTVFVKSDSYHEQIQDDLVRYSGFARARNMVLRKLIERGFTRESPTRLGLEVQVNRHTLPELRDMDRVKNHLNIYLDMVISMPCGVYRTVDTSDSMDLSLEEKYALYRDIYLQNRRYGIAFDDVSPFIGGLSCSQLGNGLYINVRGHVYPCPGMFNQLGSIRETPLGEIWKGHLQRSKYQGEVYFCPPREASGIIPSTVLALLRQEVGATRTIRALRTDTSVSAVGLSRETPGT